MKLSDPTSPTNYWFNIYPLEIPQSFIEMPVTKVFKLDGEFNIIELTNPYTDVD